MKKSLSSTGVPLKKKILLEYLSQSSHSVYRSHIHCVWPLWSFPSPNTVFLRDIAWKQLPTARNKSYTPVELKHSVPSTQTWSNLYHNLALKTWINFLIHNLNSDFISVIYEMDSAIISYFVKYFAYNVDQRK